MLKNKEKKIYLDTFCLQKWCRKTLSSEEIEFLDKLKNNCCFIFSLFHILEIAAQDDLHKSKAVGEFMGNLKHLWIKNSHVRTFKEIDKTKIEYLYQKKIEFNPFSADITDIVEPNIDSLAINKFIRTRSIAENIVDLQNNKLYLKKNKTIDLKKIIPLWVKDNVDHHKKFKETSKANSEINNLFKKILEIKIINNHNEISIEKEKLLEFIDYISKKSSVVPSLTIQFYMEHAMFRNKNKRWGSNDFGDIEHCTAYPYVDAIVLDKNACANFNSALKNIPDKKFNKNCLIVSSVKELMDSGNL